MKISVIIPVYNVRQYLEDCLKSLAVAIERCPLVEVEIICVDDGSTDGSGKMLDEYGEKVEGWRLKVGGQVEGGRLEVEQRSVTFKVIHKANGGEGSARNAGLDVATGDWMMFVDSDDVIAPQLFEDVTKAYARYPEAEIIRVCTASFKDGESPTWRIDAPMALVDMTHAVISGCYMFGVTEMVYLRKKFGHIRFKNYSIGADLVYTSQCFAIVNRLADTSCADYGYRVRPNSMAHREMSPKKMRDTIDYLEEMFTHYQESGKRIPLSIARGRGNSWFEECARDVLKMSDRTTRTELWQHWLKSLGTASRMTMFTPWQRIVVKIVHTTGSKTLAGLLLIFPNWLKVHGLHR